MASSINASTSGAGGLITTADNTGILNLQTGGTTAVTVNASQNVGIGTTTPTEKLEMTGGDFKIGTGRTIPATTGGEIFSSNGLNNDIVTNGRVAAITGGWGSLRIHQTAAYDGLAIIGDTSQTAAYMRVESSTGASIMRIDSSGQVSISNLSAYSTPEGVFTVNGNGCGDYIGAISNRNTSNCGPAHGLIIRAGYNGASSASNFFSFRRPDNTVLGAITQNGASNVSYATSSDYRLKENITPMTDALAKISALKPVTYTWKADGSAGQGFIAHELQEVVPNAVVGEKDAVDAEGNPQYQGVDTSFLVATLTAAIQEQQKIILDLKLRVENLEAVK